MNKQEVLARVDEEYIFAKYLGPIRLGKMIRSPLRRESTASFHVIRNRSGKLIFKDFGNGESGDCFKFLMLMFRTDFSGAIRIIQEDFNLISGVRVPFKRKSGLYDILQPKKEEKKTKFEWIEKEFSLQELFYWDQFGISKDILIEYDVISVREVKEINWKSPIISTATCPIFAYDYISEKIRFYRPLAFDKRFFGNSNSDDIFGYTQAFKEVYEKKEKLGRLVICAGQKDVMSFYANTGVRSIALNSESAILTKEVFNKLKDIAENINICYDADKTGRFNSQKICSEYRLRDVLNDFELREDEKDISDYFKRINKQSKQLIPII